ncbi:MAG: Dam family site-specific DNA-(adenine-N6)-methyltransferase [Leptospiraceae bacterium]|nr:Dam family site-specific DNA-(adenine-N6)-methyltransferase [Leptospiraceae bacterium]
MPKKILSVGVPPIKCQGIKTKLVKFIAESILWKGKGKWIEPFLGSGVVLFNILPERAIVGDTNKHIIRVYSDIQNKKITASMVKDFLEENSIKLQKEGQDYYNFIRSRFNEKGEPLDLIFLNRSCFNGIMRFNSQGNYNVPFGHKPERFRKGYITKIINQIKWVSKILDSRDWQFLVADWRKTLSYADKNDFVYLDPPYIGRHTDYYNNWTLEEAIALSEYSKNLNCGYALSMWLENKYRKNDHVENYWNNLDVMSFTHFYHVGSTESLRNEMQEGLIIKPKYSSVNIKPDNMKKDKNIKNEMESLFAL